MSEIVFGSLLLADHCFVFYFHLIPIHGLFGVLSAEMRRAGGGCFFGQVCGVGLRFDIQEVACCAPPWVFRLSYLIIFEAVDRALYLRGLESIRHFEESIREQGGV